MKKLTFAVVLSLIIGGSAAARTLEVLEGAYELTLAEIVMPLSPVGTAFVTACPTCSSIGVPVTPNTRYEINGRSMPLRDFLEEVAAIRVRSDGNESGVGLLYDLQTSQATKIFVIAKNPAMRQGDATQGRGRNFRVEDNANERTE